MKPAKTLAETLQAEIKRCGKMAISLEQFVFAVFLGDDFLDVLFGGGLVARNQGTGHRYHLAGVDVPSAVGIGLVGTEFGQGL